MGERSGDEAAMKRPLPRCGAPRYLQASVSVVCITTKALMAVPFHGSSTELPQASQKPKRRSTRTANVLSPKLPPSDISCFFPSSLFPLPQHTSHLLLSSPFTMAPLTPFWPQPSHPDIQEVQIFNADEFSSRSLSRIDLPPNALFAKIDFPPCTPANKPTYATVQMGRDQHLNLNSDLVYINHSCAPSLILDMSKLEIRAGVRGLKCGQELTFFYPSTEWAMDQSFDCLCGTKDCLGRISGAKDMGADQLRGYFLNGYISDLIVEREGGVMGHGKLNGCNPASASQMNMANGNFRQGVTSREMSGEMGGDTILV